MSSRSRSDTARIKDILAAIASIQKRLLEINFRQFCDDETIQKAVLYDLIIIGEAAKNISSTTQNQAPEIPWQLMGDMRNIMAHEYFQVNLQITWSTINNNLPKIIKPLQNLLESLA